MSDSVPTSGDGATGEPERPLTRNRTEKDTKDEKDEKDTGRTFDPSQLPPEAYEHLPDTLREITECLEVGHERDTFLTGVLPVCAGAMPNVLIRYGGQWLSLNHYTAVIAPAGAGKGKFRIAKQCGKELDERVYNNSRRQIQLWEQRQESEEEEGGSRPQEKTLFLPGDTSASEMKHMLQANQHSVMFETEFKTVGMALSQDWGQFRDVMLKAFHNESVTVARRKDDILRIGHPAMSAALSGTPSTFREVIEDVEDGLFSRFCFYTFDAETEWVPQFSDDTDWELEEATDEAASRLDNIHQTLTQRDEPLYVTFPNSVQEKHTHACRTVLEALKAQNVPQCLHPNVKRAGLNALRFGSIFALLRLDERATDLSEPKSVAISEADLRGGLYLAFSYLSHALQVAEEMEATDGKKGLHEGHKEYLEALPEGAFDTADADRVADELGIGDRKARRWRKKFVNKGLIVDEGYGSWRRPSSESVPGVLSVHSVLSVLFDRNGGLDRKPSIEDEGAPF
jgi:hypothetical protein